VVTPGLQALCIQTETPNRRSVASNTLFGGIDLGFYLGPLWGGLVVSQFNFSVTILSGLIPLLLAFLCFCFFFPKFTRRQRDIETQ